MGLAFALALGVASGYAALTGVRVWWMPVEVEDDDWGHERWWAGLIRGHALTAILLGALGLALAVALAVAG